MKGRVPETRTLILVLGCLMAVALTLRMIMYYTGG